MPVPTAPVAVQVFHSILLMAVPKSAQLVVTSVGLAVIISHENVKTSNGITCRESITRVSLNSSAVPF
jgi:hypothetical protein